MDLNKLNFKDYHQFCQVAVTEFLQKVLPKSEQPLHHAMRYMALSKAKHLRALLVYSVANALKAPIAHLNAAAAAVELLHCYSLVHDDLPAMDDDNIRRGQPSCHVAFDEATAILVGDALQTLCFEILSDQELNPLPAPVCLKMCQTLARAAGANGMVYGQSLDLAAENKAINLEALNQIHQHKTGALLMASCELGLLGAPNPPSPELYQKIQTFAYHIGLAFQVKDDILDVTSSTEVLGKPSKSDLKYAKSTYPSLLGLEKAREALQFHNQAAHQAISTLPEHHRLIEISDYLVNRDY